LFNVFDNIDVDITQKFMLFDCYVSPILSYASEVWIFIIYNGLDIEKNTS